jgi:hypothetical protein
MHEYEHGELESGPAGKGGGVKNRRQAIAIALNEAGASKYNSPGKNRKAEVKSERKEARGETYQQETEGRNHVGARGRRESSPVRHGLSGGARRRPGAGPKPMALPRANCTNKHDSAILRAGPG